MSPSENSISLNLNYWHLPKDHYVWIRRPREENITAACLPQSYSFRYNKAVFVIKHFDKGYVGKASMHKQTTQV
jgi:hypothetical protein